MNIFLTGGGDQEHFSRLDKKFISLLPEAARILVLPLACEDDEHDDVLERAQDCFQSKKVAAIDMIGHASETDEELIMGYDALFIEGGNTFKLVKEVRNSHLFACLKKFVEAKKIIYADSAGAIILGSDVHSGFLGDSADEDEAKLQDFRGIGLLGSWAVHCHYEPDDFEAMNELLFANGFPFLALAEPVGIYINDNQVEVFGHENLEVIDFEGRKSHAPGTVFELPQI